jgi:hypothetical protein
MDLHFFEVLFILVEKQEATGSDKTRRRRDGGFERKGI